MRWDADGVSWCARGDVVGVCVGDGGVLLLTCPWCGVPGTVCLKCGDDVVASLLVACHECAGWVLVAHGNGHPWWVVVRLVARWRPVWLLLMVVGGWGCW